MRQPVPFGKYLLLDRISVGGMAEVFKAKSYGVEGFEKIIAIKRILPTMGEDRDFIKMFIDEAKIAGQLAHANICQIFELGRIDGAHFIAMEYIWGKDLLQIQNRLRKLKQPMQVPMACFLIAKVLEGLDYAHRKRDPLGRPLEIVHRDCSPQNVLVSYEGEVKVIDFGIAKATSRNSRTMAGVLKGKFGYMSPEQVRGLPLDRRSDIFALGTMLYECLTSERLFQGETDFSTLEKVRNVDIPNPRAVNPNIPEHVERVILKALAKDVDERYQWCSEMLADIQQFLMSQDVVFTAKSLSTWLKDGFSPEIDRERQMLEQYKRVGRDGLIAGVPAAEAKQDIVENLGVGTAPEPSDATQLGGPSVEEMDAAVAAAAAVVVPKKKQTTGPSALVKPSAPKPLPPLAPKAPPGVAPPPPRRARTNDEEFGEEAPTEIFGEADGNKASSPVIVHSPAPPKPPMRPPSKAEPSGRTPPPQVDRPASTTMPLQPQPPQQQQPQGIAAAPTMQAPLPNVPATMTGGPMPAQLGAAPNPGTGPVMPLDPQNMYPQYAQQQPQYDYNQQQNGMPMGTPGPMPMQQPMNGLANGMQPPAKTLLGQPAPVLGAYPAGYRPITQPGMPVPQQPPTTPQHMTAQQQYAQPSQGYPQQYPVAPGQYSQSGQMPQHYSGQQYAQPNMLGNPSQPYMQGYPMQPQMGQPMTAVETVGPPPVVTPVEGRKRKSTLVRDIMIGVLIAAVVLGGFLLVKVFLLDSEPEPTSTIAYVKLKLPPGVTAQLFVDDKKDPEYPAVVDGQEITLNAGSRKIRIQAPQGKCDITVTLPGGETTTLQCDLKTPGSSENDSGSGSGSDTKIAAAEIKKDDPKKDPAKKDDPKKDDVKKDDPKKDPPKDDVKKDPPKDDVKKDPPKDDPKKDPKTIDVKPTDTKASDQKKTPEVKTDVVKKDDPKKDPPKDPVKDVKKDPPKDPPKDPKPPEDTSATANGFVAISSKPTAKVVVDGAATGLSTPCKIPLPPGKHKITFIVGEDKFSFNVVVKSGATVELTKDFQ